MSVMLYPCMLCVALLMCLFVLCVACLTVFVNCLAGPGICVLCLADTCTSEVHPVFNPVAPYGYLLSDMYLFMADITNPDFLV